MNIRGAAHISYHSDYKGRPVPAKMTERHALSMSSGGRANGRCVSSKLLDVQAGTKQIRASLSIEEIVGLSHSEVYITGKSRVIGGQNAYTSLPCSATAQRFAWWSKLFLCHVSGLPNTGSTS